MGQVSFKFKSNTDDNAVKSGLQNIAAISGVFNTEAVFPNDKNPEFKLMYVSDTTSGVDSKSIADQIRALPNMEYAQVAGERRPF